jgi:hypothetical protein
MASEAFPALARSTRVAAAYALLGLIATLTLASGLAAFAPVSKEPFYGCWLDAHSYWFVRLDRGIGLTWVSSSVTNESDGKDLEQFAVDATLTRDILPRWADHKLRPPTPCELVASGWPCRALQGELRWTEIRNLRGRASQFKYHAHNGILIERRTNQRPRIVPLRPIWLGLLLNTLVFALSAYALVFCVRGIHRVVIRSVLPGHCTICGYPVGTSDRCSECGARVRHHAG